ncbi:MAG TPA: hypothetical protein VMB72_10850 [Acidimicrobiales bacterium]|nr:hypothetical protein [Acidimicrobiales bacterium]
MRAGGVEGWCTDPYGIHEARWMSAGTPTSLVRDDGLEATDPPPEGPAPGEAQPILPDPPPGADVRRADDLEREAPDPRTPGQAAWEIFDEGP